MTLRSLHDVFSNITLAVLAKTGGNVGELRFLGPSTVSSKEPQKKMEHLSCFAPAVSFVCVCVCVKNLLGRALFVEKKRKKDSSVP